MTPQDAAVAGMPADDPGGAFVGVGQNAGLGAVPPPVVDPTEQFGRVEVVVDLLLGLAGGVCGRRRFVWRIGSW